MNFWLGLGMGAGIVVGMVLHEYAHARVAVAMGDKSPVAYGRLTLNPKAHMDPIGTLILPALFILPIMVGRPVGAFLFGFAKPVQTNPRAMRDQKRGPLLVALAGPATNAVLAVLAGAGIGRVGILSPVFFVLTGFMTINVFLGLINALPIPPLDGSKILGLFLSPAAAYKIEELSQYLILFLILLFLFFSGFIRALAYPLCSAASFGTLRGCVLAV